MVTSFSKSDDSLSQWRSYGNFSIEFEAHLLKVPYKNGVIFSIRSCEYNVIEKDRQAKLIGETYLKALPVNATRMDMYYLYLGYIEYISRAKSEHFFEENEIRLSSYMHKENLNVFALNNGEIGSYGGGPILAQGPVKIFSKFDLEVRGQDIKYIKQLININSIKSIRISPMIDFESNKKILENMFNKLNLDIEIKQSNIPYRV
jgi:hypothetical protein